MGVISFSMSNTHLSRRSSHLQNPAWRCQLFALRRWKRLKRTCSIVIPSISRAGKHLHTPKAFWNGIDSVFKSVSRGGNIDCSAPGHQSAFVHGMFYHFKFKRIRQRVRQLLLYRSKRSIQYHFCCSYFLYCSLTFFEWIQTFDMDFL